VTGPERYREGERLLEHAAGMLAEPVGDDGAAELLQRQAAAVGMAAVHGLLAVAAAVGLSGQMRTADETAWRAAATTRITG
jgi:hypothetical protein